MLEGRPKTPRMDILDNIDFCLSRQLRSYARVDLPSYQLLSYMSVSDTPRVDMHISGTSQTCYILGSSSYVNPGNI